MKLRIFETDPEAKPKERQTFSDDTVGKFHSGKSVDDKPVALSEWRITTGDPDVADAVAGLFGGVPEETDSTSENFIEVLTERPTVRVILAGPEAIYCDLKLWNRGKLVHHCDGVYFLSPEDKAGTVCRCPELLAERKAAAKDYMGPAPSIEVTFRLADAPDLGEFRFKSGSWTMVEVLHEYANALDAIGGPALADLILEQVEYVASRGPMKGRTVSYTKPVIKVLKAYEPA